MCRLRRLLVALALLALPPRPTLAAPASIVLDGLRDPAYVLLAEDPGGDLAAAFALDPSRQWADLTALYVARDEANLYVFASLEHYTSAHAQGQIGLAIASGASGGSTDPWTSAAFFAYTESQSRACPPQPLSLALLPDRVIRGNIVGPNSGESNDGRTELWGWDDDAWDPNGEDWGGYTLPSADQHVDYADASGVELHIPWVDLGVGSGAPLHLQFFTTAAGYEGAIDTVPSDAQLVEPAGTSALTRLAELPLDLEAPGAASFGCPDVSVVESSGPAVITVTLSTPLTTAAQISFTASAGTASDGLLTTADFTPVSGTLTFPPLSTYRTFTVPVHADSAAEPPETVLLALASPISLTLGLVPTATLTLLDGPPASNLFLPLLTRPPP